METRFNWLLISLKSKIYDSKQKTIKFLGTIGRMKYVRPLYYYLYKFDSSLAIATFKNLKNNYHPMVIKLITNDFNNMKTAASIKYLK